MRFDFEDSFGRRAMRVAIGTLGLALALTSAATAGAQDAPAKVGEESAAAAESSTADREALKKRAQAYWNARMARSAEVYDFYLPPEKGGPKSLKEISEGGNITWLEAEVTDVKVGTNWGVVYTKVKADIPVAGAFEVPEDLKNRTLQAQWNKVDGEWYKKAIPRGLSAHSQKRRERAADYRAKMKEEQEAAAKEAKRQRQEAAEAEGASE